MTLLSSSDRPERVSVTRAHSLGELSSKYFYIETAEVKQIEKQAFTGDNYKYILIQKKNPRANYFHIEDDLLLKGEPVSVYAFTNGMYIQNWAAINLKTKLEKVLERDDLSEEIRARVRTPKLYSSLMYSYARMENIGALPATDYKYAQYAAANLLFKTKLEKVLERDDLSEEIRARVTETLSGLSEDDNNVIPATDYKYAQYAAANLLWNFTEYGTAGVEYLFGRRNNFDKTYGNASRINLMVKYSF